MEREFVTILHALKSPQNVGMIVRSHVAFGGNELIFTGDQHPWQFKKGSQAFSRKLEKQAHILHIPDVETLFSWCHEREYVMVALEILPVPIYLHQFMFPQRVAFIVGNEATGLETAILSRCDAIVTIPQFGAVGSLNVAVSAAIAMYEYTKYRRDIQPIHGQKYLQHTEEQNFFPPKIN